MTSARTLLTGGRVLSMDPAIGELPAADILVEDGRITAVRPDIDATEAGERIDARGCLVLPGFVDTHRHMWQAVLRGSGADQTLDEYFATVLHTLAPRLTADDLHVGNLLSALGALDAGVTTVQDISNVAKPTEEYTDALLDALTDSGLRSVFAYGHGTAQDARRVRTRRLHAKDGLVTMALNAEAGTDETIRRGWALARELDLPTALHVRGGRPVSRLRRLGVLRPGTVFIHGTGMEDGELRMIHDSGGAVSYTHCIRDSRCGPRSRSGASPRFRAMRARKRRCSRRGRSWSSRRSAAPRRSGWRTASVPSPRASRPICSCCGPTAPAWRRCMTPPRPSCPRWTAPMSTP